MCKIGVRKWKDFRAQFFFFFSLLGWVFFFFWLPRTSEHVHQPRCSRRFAVFLVSGMLTITQHSRFPSHIVEALTLEHTRGKGVQKRKPPLLEYKLLGALCDRTEPRGNSTNDHKLRLSELFSRTQPLQITFS